MLKSLDSLVYSIDTAFNTLRMLKARGGETARTKPFTKLFGQGAIYAMTPIEEDVARVLAAQYDQRPVSVYELPNEVRQAMHAARRITGPVDPPERGADPMFDFDDDDFDDSPS